MQTPGWILVTQWASRLVLAVLMGLSVWSVAIMVDRYKAFKSKAGSSLDEARKLIHARDWKALDAWATQTSQQSTWDLSLRLPAGAIRAAMSAVPPSQNTHTESVDRAVRSYLTLERTQLEKGLTALATLGSNAPFIGLFGTVLGIIQAFGSLAAQSSNTGSVMSGISEALVATAIGLFVAIPAVVAYNIFSRRMRTVMAECDALRDYYVSRLGTQ